MDDSLLCRLARAEEDLISVICTGEEDIVSYEHAWTSLLDEISELSTMGLINDTICGVVHNVVSRVSTLVESCMSLSSIPHSQFTSLDLPSPSRHSSSFIPEAYSWLLKNIANPYPSLATKTSLSQRYNSPISAVNSWFVNARRRMGWTALCRNHFHNNRADAVDAAYRALVREDPDRRLASEIIHAFIVTKVTAEGLYSSSFTKSPLASDLDAVVRDMTDDESISEDGQGREIEEGILATQGWDSSRNVLERRLQGKRVAPDCYPSPSHSRTPSPAPLICESDEQGRGPRLPSQQPLGSVPPTAVKPITYPCPSSTYASLSEASGIETPEDSFNVSPTPSDAMSPFPIMQYRTNATASRKRRRLSDPDPGISPKRMRGSTIDPRPHAVSDPLACSKLASANPVDEWFSTNFDAFFTIPPPVDAAEPDLSTQWEVELFRDYCIPLETRRRTPNLPLAVPQGCQNPLSADLTEFERLLQPIQDGGLIPHSEAATTGTHIKSPLSGPPPNNSVAASELSIDWIALLDDTAFESGVAPQVIGPYHHLQSLPDIDYLTLTSKEAKLQQLQAMQEAVRRMEHELQLEAIGL